MLLYLSYLKAFGNYANFLMVNSTEFVQIGSYANLLTEKANELIDYACLNEEVNVANLQKDMFEMGGKFVKQFSERFKKRESAESALCSNALIMKNLPFTYSNYQFK